MTFDVSVVIPSYNYGKYIAKAVDSVINQTGVNVDVIVVDDGSTDDTLQILQAYKDRLRVFQQAHLGVPYARNLGIEKAECEFITFLDADDWLLEDSLFRRCSFLKNHAEYDWVYGRWLIGDSDGNIIGTSEDFFGHADGILEGDIFPSLLRGFSGVNTLTPLFRTPDVRAVGGYNTSLKGFEDYDFLLRMSRGRQVGFCPEGEFGVQRLHMSHHSSNPELRYEAELEILQAYASDKEAMGFLKQNYGDRVSNLYNYLACIYGSKRQWALALKSCIHSILTKPVQLFAYRVLFYLLTGRPENAGQGVRNEVMEIYMRIKEGKQAELVKKPGDKQC